MNRNNPAIIMAIIIISFISLTAVAQQAETAKNTQGWQYYASAEAAGFSSTKLAEAEQLYESVMDAAGGGIMVVYKGKILVDWGDTKTNHNCRSARISLLSALIGIHVGEGNIDLNETLSDLGIGDIPFLWHSERQAKVVHLLKSRSGIYHEAAGESQYMRDMRPDRGSHSPDSFWYYNNWDFNALGTIFSRETGEDIFEEFKRGIADPIGMDDFRLSDCSLYYQLRYSFHPVYVFNMSVRDRARFGQLYLQNGSWGDREIIPASWIKESTKAHSSTDSIIAGGGFGYMWWILPKEAARFLGMNNFSQFDSFVAGGYNDQNIYVIPENDMVIAIATDADREVAISPELTGALLDMIIGAKEFETIDLSVLRTKHSPGNVKLGERLTLTSRIYNLSREESAPTTVDYYLSRTKAINTESISLGQVKLGSIEAGRKETAKLTVKLKTTIMPGKYYVITQVDREDISVDPDPSNNIKVSNRRITIN